MRWFTQFIVMIGGLNWGLVGLFNFNLVNFIFQWSHGVERAIYVIVGIFALILLGYLLSECPAKSNDETL